MALKSVPTTGAAISKDWPDDAWAYAAAERMEKLSKQDYRQVSFMLRLMEDKRFANASSDPEAFFMNGLASINAILWPKPDLEVIRGGKEALES